MLMLISLFLLTYSLSATNYYISNNGNDNNNGLSEETPWQTINKVNATTFNAGDNILFERGGVWREELIIQQSGTAQNYITYSVYGSGNKPRILGSNRAEAWTEVQDNIWESSTELIAPRQRTGHSTTNHPASIFFEEKNGAITWGNMENIHLNNEGAPKDICERDRDNGFSLMDEEYDWCWGDNHIYVYCTENPGDRYNCVEVPQRMTAIKMASHNAQEYIKIENLELMFTVKHGVDCGWPMAYELRGLQVLNCHIGFLGTKGAASSMGLQVWHSDMLIRGNEIHDCGRRNISYNVYSDTRTESLVFENVIIDNNELYNGYHTTGVDLSAGYADEFNNFTISNNYIWDNPDYNTQNAPNGFSSMGVYLYSGPATYNNFKVYNNVFSFIKQKHLIANSLKNSIIVNNTFCGMNVTTAGEGYRQMILVSGEPENLSIDNNIFYGNIDDEYVLSAVTFSGSSGEGTTMNNNLYYHEYPSQRMVTVNATGESYTMSEWDSYKSETGWDKNSPTPSDPMFNNMPDDLSLQANSPAINAAKYYAEISTDILGYGRNTEPSIGAYEFDGIISMNYAEQNSVAIYPNPSNGRVYIANNSKLAINSISVTDISGKVIVNKLAFSEGMSIDLSAVHSGMYIVRVSTETKAYTVKLIKE